MSTFQKKRELLQKVYQRAYETYPDDMFLQLLGVNLYAHGKFAEAESIFQEAIEGFSIYPSVSKEAKFFAFACRAGIFVKTKNEQDLQKAANYLAKPPVASIKGPKINSTRFELAFGALARVGRWDIARELVDAQIRDGADKRSLMIRMPELAEGFEQFGTALQLWDELLLIFPGDVEIIESRNALIKKLALQIEESTDATGE